MNLKDDSSSKNIEKREETLPDPLTLHHSDTLGLTLINTPLDGHNYGQWSCSMRLSLSAKNKLGLIDGIITAPPSTDAKFPIWQCCNDLVLTWILHSIHTDITRNIIFFDTAATVWSDLQDQFSREMIQESIKSDKKSLNVAKAPSLFLRITLDSRDFGMN
ncbi:Retrotransposon gag protein [Abeliophyllum distichum]|uniref:Retrotransposon gag protein n=1 Tax=Abeliophyllum distichum TaxID=126358 RepID=A0ABD1PDA8_9LAMI